MNKIGSNKMFFWIAFMFCFAGIPGLLLTTGLFYTHTQHLANQISLHQSNIGRSYSDLQAYADGQKFWCHYLNSRISPTTINGPEAQNKLKSTLEKAHQNFGLNYILFTSTKTIASSFELKPFADWKLTMSYLADKRKYERPTQAEENAVGRTLGPQTAARQFDRGHDLQYMELVWPDSTFHKPAFWLRRIGVYVVIVFIEYDQLDAVEGITSFLNSFREEHDNEYDFAFARAGAEIELLNEGHEYKQQLEEARDVFERSRQSRFETDDLIVMSMSLRPDFLILGTIRKSTIKSPLTWLHAILILLWLLYTIILGRYSFRVQFDQSKDSLSLKRKLRYLFFFANGIPLLVLFFIGTDYLNQKRGSLLRETYNEGVSFLQNYDERFDAEYARQLADKQKAEQILRERLNESQLSDSIVFEFFKNLGGKAWRTIMIASDSTAIVTEHGILDEKRGVIPEGVGKGMRSQADLLRRIGQFFISTVNGTRISEKLETEIELLIESVTQKPMVNFVFRILAHRGRFMQWGFGNNINPAIIDTLSTNPKDPLTQDYFLISIYRRLPFQHDFITKSITNANRNSLGLKVFCFHDHEFTVPQEAYGSLVVREFAQTLTSYPGNELSFLNINDQEYLSMGFMGNYLTEFGIIGLYPLKKIDDLIASQRRQLSVFAVMSLLLTLSLAQVLAQSFVFPLNQLTVGAHAIENKKFSHRLPKMSRDEFGAMGQIFNNVMVDLEELSVASAIQEQLLPQEPIETGKFSLYGKSIAMVELGGDYFDYFNVSEETFSVLLGDVAGHGVGAAMIMAMAKAGVIQLEHLADQPLALLERLHQLIHASKTKKQRKIMTLQYMYLNAQTGKGKYSNAGGCSPMVVRKSINQVEELTLSGAPLGAFKKARLSEIDFEFEDGDALVMYTDGIVECRNDAGEELGYDNFKRLCLDCWNLDAEKYYQNLLNAYTSHIQSQGDQDDLTLVILVFNKEADNV